jgi:hypothetical protein
LEASYEDLEILIGGISERTSEELKDGVKEKLKERLSPSLSYDDSQSLGKSCATATLSHEEYNEGIAAYLIRLACSSNAPHIANGIALHRLGLDVNDHIFRRRGDLDDLTAKKVARALLGQNEKTCPGIRDLNAKAAKILRELASAS